MLKPRAQRLRAATRRPYRWRAWGRLLARLADGLRAAIAEESAQAERAAARAEEQARFARLPDPPHLQYGELKYGEGMHDYFRS